MPPSSFIPTATTSWQSLLDLVRGARRSIDLCTYVLGRDEIGEAIVDELTRAAGRGVRVRLLLDAFGSLRASRSRLTGLRTAGGAVKWFMPLLRNQLRGRTNLRNHRKLAIADELIVWGGGRNQALEYSWIARATRLGGPELHRAWTAGRPGAGSLQPRLAGVERAGGATAAAAAHSRRPHRLRSRRG
jgi:phosphatidylserine/phosphatidylglycerophosphate/cardiolipin synthase-like enzyme